MKQEITIIFKGNVQGVFFRHHAKKFADELSIKGYAKNLNDGSVEIRAVGEKKDLEKFIEKVKKTPGYGKIESFKSSFSKELHDFEDFKTI